METLTAIIFRHGEKLRFLISGGLAFLTSISILYVFTDILHVWYIISSVLAFVFAFGVSFSLQKFWTFRNHNIEVLRTQMSFSFIVALINLAINTVLLYGMVEFGHLYYLVAQVIATGLIACETYFVYKHVIFRSV